MGTTRPRDRGAGAWRCERSAQQIQAVVLDRLLNFTQCEADKHKPAGWEEFRLTRFGFVARRRPRRSWVRRN
jgi:hypothetical protein